jgi:hypothetical protein
MTADDLVLLGITSTSILYVFSWGFAMMLFGWAAGFGIQLAVGLIRRI